MSLWSRLKKKVKKLFHMSKPKYKYTPSKSKPKKNNNTQTYHSQGHSNFVSNSRNYNAEAQREKARKAAEAKRKAAQLKAVREAVAKKKKQDAILKAKQAKIKLISQQKKQQSLNKAVDKYNKSQEDKKKLQGGLSDTEVTQVQNISRMPAQAQQLMYSNLEKGNSEKYGIKKGFAGRVAKSEEAGAKSNPMLYGFIQGSSPIGNKKFSEEVTGKKINTDKAEKSAPYKLGYVGGQMLQYLSTGGVAESAIAGKLGVKGAIKAATKASGSKTAAKALVKNASKKGLKSVTVNGKNVKLSSFASRRAADAIASTPLNLSQSIGQSDNKKDVVKNYAVNTATDMAFGTALEGAGKGAKSLYKVIKKTKKGKVPKIGDTSNSLNTSKSVSKKAEMKVSAYKKAKELSKPKTAEVKTEIPNVVSKVSDVNSKGSAEVSSAKGTPKVSAKGTPKVSAEVSSAKGSAEVKKADSEIKSIDKEISSVKNQYDEGKIGQEDYADMITDLEIKKNAEIEKRAKILEKQGSDVAIAKSLDDKGTTTPKSVKTSKTAEKQTLNVNGKITEKSKPKTPITDVKQPKEYKTIEKYHAEDDVPDWVLEKDLNEGERFAFRNSEKKVVRETEKARLIEADTDYGKVSVWVPKSVQKPTTKLTVQEQKRLAKAVIKGDGKKVARITEEIKNKRAKTGKVEETELEKEWEQAQKNNPTYKNGTPSRLDGKKQPKTIDTAMGDKGIVQDKKVQDSVKTDLLANELGYDVEKMADISYKAKKSVSEDANKAYEELMLSTKGSSRDIATASELYTHYSKIGDVEKASKALEKASQLATESGRTVNAVKLFMKETPAGRIRTMENIEKKLNEKYSKILKEDVKLSESTKAEIRDAKTEQEIQVANDKAQLELWNQIPPTFKEKFDAFRYLAMLGNPKTHIRNIVGNFLFTIPRKGKDILATAGEKMATKAGILEEGKGTKALLTSNDKSLVDFGEKSFAENVDGIRNNSARWHDSARPQESKVFNTGFLETLRKFNGNALDAEDVAFMKPAYANSMARYMKARNLTPKDMTGDVLSKAEEHATKESLKATYRDFTEVGNWLSKIKNAGPNATKAQKAAAVIVESTVPFAKTPVNILRRGIDYSPVGLANGTGKLIKAAKSGDNAMVSEAIDKMAAGLTGTGLFGLGLALNKMGIITTDLGSDAKGKYDKDTGKQGYSINIGGYSITLDWAVPAAIPFFFGAEIGNTIKQGKTNIGTLLDNTGKMLNPVAELSMMQGVTNTLQGLKGAKSAGDILSNIGTNIGINYLTQAVPTVLGQISRTIDDTQRSTTSTSSSAVGRTLETALLRQKNKIPFLSKTSEPYINKWGEEVKSGNVGERIFENFISPAYVSKDISTQTDKEINRLYGKLGDDTKSTIIPKSASGYDLAYNGDKVRMSKKDLTTYNKTKGKASYKMVSALMKTDMYKIMSDSEKADAIANVYKNTGKGAKATTLIDKGKNDINVMSEVYEMGRGKTNRLKEYKGKGHNVKDIIKEDQNIKMKSNGINAKVITAASLLEDKTNKDMYKYYGVIDKINPVKAYLRNGGSSSELSSVQMRMKSIAKNKKGSEELNNIEKAFAIADVADSNRVYGLYDETKSKLLSTKYKNTVRGLLKMGKTPTDIYNIKASVDSNGNGRISKEEAIRGAEKFGRNTTEKSVIYDAIANWNSKNPYGSRSFKASKSKPKTKTVKTTTIKKVQAPKTAILQTGKTIDLTKMSKSDIADLMRNSSYIKAIKFGTVNRKVTTEKKVNVSAKDNTVLPSISSSSGGYSRSGYSRRGRSGGGSGGGSGASSNITITATPQKLVHTNWNTKSVRTNAQIKSLLKQMLKNNYS